jgi:DHA2 family multidrug resistance protein-like MFS transporter
MPGNSNAPLDKVGVASGIYKMASSLGGAFGVAISGAVYSLGIANKIAINAMIPINTLTQSAIIAPV